MLKRLLITVAVLAVLGMVIGVLVGQWLDRNGIAYDSISFSLPASATVKGLVVRNDAIDIRAGQVQATWSWRALLSGEINGESIALSDAVAIFKSSDGEKDTASSIPVIDIRRARLNNVTLQWQSGIDSSTLRIQYLEAVGLRYDGTITLDSLINNHSRFTAGYTASPDTSASKKSGASETAFTIQSLPGFRIGHINFQDCDFRIRYSQRDYSVTQFNLQFSGLNNHDVMDMSLQRLAFRYQDSLDVNIALNDASIDSQNDATFTKVLIELPDFRLAAPNITLSNKGGFHASATFDSSYFNTHLLNFFFPSLRQWIPDQTHVVVDGTVAYAPNRIVLDRTTVTLGEDAKISGTGFLEFGDGHDSLRLDIPAVHTTLFGLARWIGFKIPPGQKDIPLQLQGKAMGTYSHLQSHGEIASDKTSLHYKTSFVGQGDETTVNLILESPLVVPGMLLTAFENDLRLVGLSLNGTTVIKQGTLHNIHFQLVSDSLFVSNRWLDAPRVSGDYSPTHTVASLTFEKDKYAAQFDISGDILSDQGLNCTGSLRGQVPHFDDFSLAAGDLYTRFHGHIETKLPAVDMVFDSIRFKPPGQTVFSSSAKLKIASQPDKSLKALLSIDHLATINAQIGNDLVLWLDRDDKLEHFPTATVSMSVHADTTTLRTLMGISAKIEIENFLIVSSPETIKIDFKADTVIWNNYGTRNLVGALSFQPGQLTAKIETPEVITPATLFDSVKLEVVTQRDSAFRLSLNTYLPEIERPLGVSYYLVSQRDGYRISFADSILLLGLQRWKADPGGSLFVGRTFDIFSGQLGIINGSQTALLQGMGKELLWKLDGLDLFPIAKSIAAEPAIHGIMNASVSSNFRDGIFQWNGHLTGASVDTVHFGDLVLGGAVTPDSLSAYGRLHSAAYEILASANKSKDGPSRFDVKVNDVDLAKFSSLLPVPPSTLTVIGKLNADVHGSYDKRLVMRGFVALPNTEVISSEYDMYFRTETDSLVLDGTTASLSGFVLRDRQGNAIDIRGKVKLAESAMDITIKSDRFRMLDRTQKKATLSGAVDLGCDIRIRGQDGNYKVTGKIATLSGASLTYLYKSTVTLDDRQREMEFVSFTQKASVARTRPRRKLSRKPLEWDVTVDVGKIDVTVLFSEVNQDHINTSASGSVAFKTGNSAEPSAFGHIESNSGSIAYHVPMISDLRMTISKAGVRWVGDVAKPLLSFNGFQVFRLSPNEISSLWTNKTDKWPISVVAKVNDRPLNDLVLDFDLSSTNNQVSDWIATLPADTREAYAVSLLLRGRINTGGAADVNLLSQAMVSKMNEISSRNIKSADVSFYDESRGPNSTEGSTTKIGYSISKGLMNKKVRVVLGGSVDLTGKADPGMSDVKVEYILREDPTITLRAGKANVYTGVIDGNVDESSFGVTYIKRFRNLFKHHEKSSTE